MFNPFRKLFGRRADTAVEEAPAPRPFTPIAQTPRAQVVRQTRAEAPRATGPAPANFALPLKTVLARLPAELMQRVRQMDVGETELFIPMQKVISQIGTGAVRLSFGELRQAAPPGTFTPENDRDRTLVDLPLEEILSRIEPSLLPRRQGQRHIEVPAEVVGPFGGQNKVVIANDPIKAGTQAKPVQQPAAAPAPAPVQPAPRPPAPVQPVVQPAVAKTPAAPANPIPMDPIPRTQPKPAAPAIPVAAPAPVPFKPAAAPAPAPSTAGPIPFKPVANPAPAPFAPSQPLPRFQPAIPVPGRLQPVAAKAPAQPTPVAAPAAPAAAPATPTFTPRLTPQAAPAKAAPSFQPTAAPLQPTVPTFKPAPVATAPAPAKAPVPSPFAAPTPGFETPVFTKAPTAPQAAKPVPVAKVVAPVAPLPTPIAAEDSEESTGDTEVIPMPDAFRKSSPAAPISPVAPAASAVPTLADFSTPEPAEAPEPPMPEFPGETRFLSVSLAELSLSWPEAVRQEINMLHLSTAVIGLPMAAVEGSIRSGKIAFPWKALRSWVKPPMPFKPSQYDTTMLELPLKVVTPLFVAELKSGRPQKKVAVDTTIPNLFFNSPPPEAAAALAAATAAPHAAPAQAAPHAPTSLPTHSPAPHAPALRPDAFTPPKPVTPAAVPATAAATKKQTDTNYYVWRDDADKPDDTSVFKKKESGSPSTAFLNRYATPNEIVTKAAALAGVDGAIIALPDGLLVASRIPASMNADTIAAFLPQIFGRVSQCTRELRLGDLNNLNFTVGNVPWKIFRVGSIYFAVFGRPGEPLPTSNLVGLAAELDRKAK